MSHCLSVPFVKSLDGLKHKFCVGFRVYICNAHIRMRKEILYYQRVCISPNQFTSKVGSKVVEMIVFFSRAVRFIDFGSDENRMPAFSEIHNWKWKLFVGY